MVVGTLEVETMEVDTIEIKYNRCRQLLNKDYESENIVLFISKELSFCQKLKSSHPNIFAI